MSLSNHRVVGLIRIFISDTVTRVYCANIFMHVVIRSSPQALQTKNVMLESGIKCQLERTEGVLETVPGFLAVQIYLHRLSVIVPSAAGIARLTFYNMHGNFAYISLC